MTTRVLTMDEYKKIIEQTNTGCILTDTMEGNLNVKAPNQKGKNKNYYKYNVFAIHEDIVEGVDDLLNNYIPYLLLIPRDNERFLQNRKKMMEKQGIKDD